MARNPAQIGNHQQLHTLFLASGAAQFPEFTGKSQILSANPKNCFQARGELEASVVWWQVAIHAAEVWRQTTNPAEALALLPLGQSFIVNLADQPVTAGPAPAPGPAVLAGLPLLSARYSALKARVTFSDQTAIQRVVELDIGGGATLAFFGSHVGVDVLYPEPGIVLPPGAGPSQLDDFTPLPEGIVLDSWIQASAAPSSCAPIGRRACRYTLTRILAAGVPFLFEIPAGAVEAEIYVNPAAAIPGTTFRWVAGPLTGLVVPVADIPPAFVSSHKFVVPGTARWLEVVAGAPQTVTVVYTLEY
jgi:hypothetical protein